mgnify:CR=1 FL=1
MGAKLIYIEVIVNQLHLIDANLRAKRKALGQGALLLAACEEACKEPLAPPTPPHHSAHRPHRPSPPAPMPAHYPGVVSHPACRHMGV